MAAPSSEAVIRVENLSTRLGDSWVHRGVDFTARRGEVLAIVGASGSGKSALLHQLVGLLTPAEGRVEVLGVDVNEVTGPAAERLRRRWGILFQGGGLFTPFTVFENVAFPLRELAPHGGALDERTIRDLTWLKLAMVELGPEDARKLPAELSGGMAKRAALARALALDAELLFLDEPTTGLDPELAREFTELIIEVRRELDVSCVVISHDLQMLAALSDRLAVLAEGRIAAVGTLEELASVDDPVVSRLFVETPGQARLERLLAKRS